jgi:hypothetical protein
MTIKSRESSTDVGGILWRAAISSNSALQLLETVTATAETCHAGLHIRKIDNYDSISQPVKAESKLIPQTEARSQVAGNPAREKYAGCNDNIFPPFVATQKWYSDTLTIISNYYRQRSFTIREK